MPGYFSIDTSAMGWQLIGSFSQFASYYGSMWAFNDGSDFILAASGAGINAGAGEVFLRIDKNGNWGQYQTRNYSGSLYYGGATGVCAPLGYGQFIWATEKDGILYINLPKDKLNKVLGVSFSAFPWKNSCRTGSPNNTFFDPLQFLVAGEWIESLGVGDNYYSSIFKINQFGDAIQITDGFVGSGTSDPFNKTYIKGASYPFSYGFGAGYYSYQQNGILFGTNQGSESPSQTGIIFAQNQIHQGSMSDCVTPNNSYVDTPYAIAFNNGFAPGFNYNGEAQGGSTDILGNGFRLGNTGDAWLTDILGNAYQFFGVPTTNFQGNTASLDSNGNFFVANWQSVNGPLNIYYLNIFAFLQSYMGLYNPPSVKLRNSLINLARPISVFQQYKT